MEITNAQTAQRFVTAWSGQRRSVVALALEGVERAAMIADRQRQAHAAQDYRAAATVLRAAA
jgi:hypothetical protein